MRSAKRLIRKANSKRGVILCMVLALAVHRVHDVHSEETSSHRKPLPSGEELKALPKDGGPDFNRLVFEKSPYLLQHASNPVHWFPWGDEAFAKAKAEEKPIFLSIGYSTCHWCHVMEAESFEDAEVAALLNQSYIAIKVDREERPDIDQIYMTVTQAMTGSGGWPMTIIMTPDKRPFFAGTYFPKEGRPGRPGLMELLPAVASAWKDKRDQLVQLASEITVHLSEGANSPKKDSAAELNLSTLRAAYAELSGRFDAEHGGFGEAPKFPTPHNLTFLLRYWRRTSDKHALEMTEATLAAMRRGGVYDQIGLGFHRYSTDPNWLVPHFEKMIYDQALIAMAYVEAFQATRKEEYAATAREIFTYVLRDMTSPEGGFYSAEDADSGGSEGKFYLWTPTQIEEVLGKEEGSFCPKVFGIVTEGNFADQATGKRSGENIPHLEKSLVDTAKDLKMSEGDLRARVEASRAKLFAAREKRIHPFKDDKILTDWNGLMIAALAQAGRVLEEPRFTVAARKAADFILSKTRTPDGRLLHRYRAGDAALPGHLEDYAFLVWGLIELYETTFDVPYLKAAIDLNGAMLAHFWDGERGGLFLTADDAEKLLTRPKEVYDGAQPSGNSVAALNLIRLARLTGKMDYEAKAGAIFKAFAGDVARSPSAFTQLLNAVDFSLGPSFEIVIAGKPGADDTKAMLKALESKFDPNKVVVFRPEGETNPPIVALAPYTEHQLARDGKATAYVCENFACNAPTTDISVMMKALDIKPATKE